MAARQIAALVGDYYHRPEPMRDTLQETVDRMGIPLKVYMEPSQLPWDSLGDLSGLVIVKENRVSPAESKAVWATAQHEAAIASYAAAGGAVIGLHNGLASYDVDGAYFQTVRGGFQYHPKEHPRFQVRALTGTAVGGGHLLLTGFSPFELKDEMYFVRVDSARTTRLLELANPDYGTSCAAWAHTVGAGRVFCFTPGHTAEVLNDPGYRRFLERGLRWALGLQEA